MATTSTTTTHVRRMGRNSGEDTLQEELSKADLKEMFNQHVGKPEYRGDFLSSVLVACRTLVAYMVLWAAAIYGGNYGMSLGSKAGLIIIWGFVHIRCFIIYHDCGHQSFLQGFKGAQTWNEAAKMVFAALSNTPSDWSISHSLHHNNMGNCGQSDYEWCETVFHNKKEYLAEPLVMKWIHAFIRHPVIFFTMAPFLTWWVKMRIPINSPRFPKASYRFSNKMMFLAIWVAHYYAAYRYQYCLVLFLSHYVGAFVGVILFHWQHVFEKGYVRPADQWSYHDASVLGSSLVLIPECFKWVTMGIEYHHIHHARTRIPGYMLRQCHDEAPDVLWKDIVVLGPKEMWDSLWMTVWDEDKQVYSTFSQVLADHEAACK